MMKYADSDVRKIINEQEKKEIETVVDLLTGFKNIIRIKDLEVAATLIYYSVENIAHNIKFNKIRVDENRIISEFTDMLIRYLLDSF